MQCVKVCESIRQVYVHILTVCLKKNRCIHIHIYICAAAAAKSLQSCPTLCEPMDCSLPGSSVHGILQARILEWVAISFSRNIYIYIHTHTHIGI